MIIQILYGGLGSTVLGLIFIYQSLGEEKNAQQFLKVELDELKKIKESISKGHYGEAAKQHLISLGESQVSFEEVVDMDKSNKKNKKKSKKDKNKHNEDKNIIIDDDFLSPDDIEEYGKVPAIEEINNEEEDIYETEDLAHLEEVSVKENVLYGEVDEYETDFSAKYSDLFPNSFDEFQNEVSDEVSEDAIDEDFLRLMDSLRDDMQQTSIVEEKEEKEIAKTITEHAVEVDYSALEEKIKKENPPILTPPINDTSVDFKSLLDKYKPQN